MLRKNKLGFTLIELLVVISIIGLLSAVGYTIYSSSVKRGKIAQAVSNAKDLQQATNLYLTTTGFYPPDLGRGWDPGYMQLIPTNPDDGSTNVAALNAVVPLDAQAKWDGPYLTEWPKLTPWGGKYDYNYWPVGASRYGCTVPAGVYMGIQGDYSNNNTVPLEEEQQMIGMGLDQDGCLNGEVQMKLLSL